MLKSERELACLILVTIFTITTLVIAETTPAIRECDLNDLTPKCNPGERCAVVKSLEKPACICLRDHIRDKSGEKCVLRPTERPPLPETTTEKMSDTNRSSGNSVAVGLLVPTFLVGLGVAGFCIARRYRLLPCRRNLYGNVLVTRDDDDDDPPIA